jgi:hypothetical protein
MIKYAVLTVKLVRTKKGKDMAVLQVFDLEKKEVSKIWLQPDQVEKLDVEDNLFLDFPQIGVEYNEKGFVSNMQVL